MPKRIREWWFKNELGKVCFCVKYGSRPLELAKGKHNVEVGNPAELVKALNYSKAQLNLASLMRKLNWLVAQLEKALVGKVGRMPHWLRHSSDFV